MTKPLLFNDYYIAFQEVPNEVSLVFTISGCPHMCEGCHSPELREYKGKILKKEVEHLLYTYQDFVTCVCFMGGDQETEQLVEICRDIHNKYNKKTCLYSGDDKIRPSLLDVLDFVKTGEYKQELGGLDSKETNQKFFQKINDRFIDKTYLFWNKPIDS